MILTIDVGNSNIVLVGYDAHRNRIYDARYETLKDESNGSFQQFIQDILNPAQEREPIEDFILSSVVPSITETLLNEIQKELDLTGHVCTIDSVPSLTVHLDKPRDIGADLIATSIGALRLKKLPAIIVDMGSATKITVVEHPNVFEGGLILPGLKISQDALNQFIPHLPHIPLEVPHEVMGHSTIEAMQSGLMYSAIESVIGISNRIEQSLGKPCYRYLTGGLSNPVNTYLPMFQFEPYLLNDGLIEIYDSLSH